MQCIRLTSRKKRTAAIAAAATAISAIGSAATLVVGYRTATHDHTTVQALAILTTAAHTTNSHICNTNQSHTQEPYTATADGTCRTTTSSRISTAQQVRPTMAGPPAPAKVTSTTRQQQLQQQQQQHKQRRRRPTTNTPTTAIPMEPTDIQAVLRSAHWASSPWLSWLWAATTTTTHKTASTISQANPTPSLHNQHGLQLNQELPPATDTAADGVALQHSAMKRKRHHPRSLLLKALASVPTVALRAAISRDEALRNALLNMARLSMGVHCSCKHHDKSDPTTMAAADQPVSLYRDGDGAEDDDHSAVLPWSINSDTTSGTTQQQTTLDAIDRKYLTVILAKGMNQALASEIARQGGGLGTWLEIMTAEAFSGVSAMRPLHLAQYMPQNPRDLLSTDDVKNVRNFFSETLEMSATKHHAREHDSADDGHDDRNHLIDEHALFSIMLRLPEFSLSGNNSAKGNDPRVPLPSPADTLKLFQQWKNSDDSQSTTATGIRGLFALMSPYVGLHDDEIHDRQDDIYTEEAIKRRKEWAKVSSFLQSHPEDVSYAIVRALATVSQRPENAFLIVNAHGLPALQRVWQRHQDNVRLRVQVARALGNIVAATARDRDRSWPVVACIAEAGFLPFMVAREWGESPPHTKSKVDGNGSSIDKTSAVMKHAPVTAATNVDDWGDEAHLVTKARLQASRCLINMRSVRDMAILTNSGPRDFSEKRGTILLDEVYHAFPLWPDTRTHHQYQSHQPGARASHRKSVPDTAVDVDVIFVHGVGGNALTTWLSLPRDEHGTSEVWPMSWLPHDLLDRLPTGSSVRILMIGYESSLWSSPNSKSHNESMLLTATNSDLTLEEQGDILLKKMIMARVHDSSTSPQDQTEAKCAPSATLSGRQRRILWVTHSMGGLVVKQALSRHPTLLNKTDGIIFFATPHFGCIWSWIPLFSGISKLVGALKQNNTLLHSLNEMVLHGNPHIEILSFGEALPIVLNASNKELRDGPPKGALPPIGFVVVPTWSSNPNTGEFVQEHGACHRTICKFQSRDSATYQRTVDFLVRVATQRQ